MDSARPLVSIPLLIGLLLFPAGFLDRSPVCNGRKPWKGPPQAFCTPFSAYLKCHLSSWLLFHLHLSLKALTAASPSEALDDSPPQLPFISLLS